MAGGLRLTGGQARGRVIRLPVMDGVRPTSSRVREALFSIVGQDLHGVRVLDAFGGSGLLGFEAWSRGAEVVICERRPKVAAAIRAVAAELRAEVEVIVDDVHTRASQLGPFDGVLADPPYADDPVTVLTTLAPVAGSWLVYEADASRTLPPTVGLLSLDRVRGFGGTALGVYVAVHPGEP